mgnify:CR=1 FL=1
MAFFSFSLLKESLNYLSLQIQPNIKYYSKDIYLWKELNNRNKNKRFCILDRERRLKSTNLGRKLLIFLPPKFGLGDAIEYCIAIKSLLKSKKFSKIGIAFTGHHTHIFKEFLSSCCAYPLIVSKETIKKYDTLFHITLEIEALRFQKYFRSNIVIEICKHFKVPVEDIKIKNNKDDKNYFNTISIFPVSNSVIRSLPFKIIKEIIEGLRDEYEYRIIIDDSIYSKNLQKENTSNKFKFVKPINAKQLIKEVSKINFGIFVDSGPLHLAKIFNKRGILVETSVSEKVLLHNSKKIFPIKNNYRSKYCKGPCGLVDIFNYKNKIGCYESNKVSFENVKKFNSFKNLQRFDKKAYNTNFIINPVGCIKNINVKNILEFIKIKI